jgi:AraC-like DNA-binding protein
MRVEQETNCGLVETLHVRSGLDVCIADFSSPRTIETIFEKTSLTLRFYFYISGGGHWQFRSPYENTSQNELVISDRLSTILYYSELEGKKCWQPKCRQFHIGIHIAPSLLSAYLSGRLDEFPNKLRAIFDGCTDKGFSHVGSFSHTMNVTIQNLLDCPYDGLMKELYIENKAIELIVHKLAQIVSPRSLKTGSSKFDSREFDRLELARDILCRDLEKPPKLFDLVAAVGLDHCRLNQGFRKLYGTTVFGYLKHTRLTEAKRLLEQDGMNVTEAALSVGYSSISSFSNAFLEYYGMRPIACFKKKS